MLKKFMLTNYKNFNHALVIDFDAVGGYQFNTDCLADGMISKMLIYGRNATGKSNLGKAIVDIAMPKLPTFLRSSDSDNFLNADSEENYARFDYVFQFGKDEIRYVYDKFSAVDYKYEALFMNGVPAFQLDYLNEHYAFDHLNLISAETIVTDRFVHSMSTAADNDMLIEQPSFLKWLFANAAFSTDSLMAKLQDYIGRMAYYSLSGSGFSTRGMAVRSDSFLQRLEGEELKKLQMFLNTMGVDCELVSQRLPDDKNAIYFKHKKLVPFFETASSGTMVLFNLYQRLVTRMKGFSLLYLDEFDACFHYEMSERFLKYLKSEFPNCQVILTTHNTNLMTNRLMRPDCVFVLSQEGALTPLNKATTRELREGHNLEKLYMGGEFDEK